MQQNQVEQHSLGEFTQEKFEKWLIEKVAEESGMESNEINIDLPFEDFDLDSLSVLSLSFEVEKLLDKEISPTVFTEFNTITKLSEWMFKQE